MSEYAYHHNEWKYDRTRPIWNHCIEYGIAHEMYAYTHALSTQMLTKSQTSDNKNVYNSV